MANFPFTKEEITRFACITGGVVAGSTAIYGLNKVVYKVVPQSTLTRKVPQLAIQMASITAGVTLASVLSYGLNEWFVKRQPQQQAVRNENQPREIEDFCSFELKQFLACAEKQPDISLCQGFSDGLDSCRRKHGGGRSGGALGH